MLRKLAVIFVAVFLRSAGSRVQAFALFLLLLIFLALTHRRRPFLTRRLNQMELLSLGASAVTVYAGFFFLSARPRDDPSYDINRDFVLPPIARCLLFLQILFANLCFFVYWTSGVAASLRTKCRVKCPRLFLCCCLCNRREMLNFELKHAKAFDRIEAICGEIDGVIESKFYILASAIARTE